MASSSLFAWRSVRSPALRKISDSARNMSQKTSRRTGGRATCLLAAINAVSGQAGRPKVLGADQIDPGQRLSELGSSRPLTNSSAALALFLDSARLRDSEIIPMCSAMDPTIDGCCCMDARWRWMTERTLRPTREGSGGQVRQNTATFHVEQRTRHSCCSGSFLIMAV